MERESEVTQRIIKFLRSCGCFCFKHWSGGFARRGIADILGCLPDGRFLAVEVKRPVSGRVTEHQERFIDDVNKAGGLGFIAKSVEDVQGKLESIGVIPPQGSLF